MPRFSPSRFFGPSRCLIPTPRLTSEYPIFAVCLCVCVYTRIYPHILPPALKIEKIQTTPLSVHLSKITPHAKQQELWKTSWTPLSSFPNAKWNKVHIHARICTSCREREANVYADVHNICLLYTPAHAWCAQHQWMHAYSPQKCNGLVHARLCNGASASLPWKLLQTYLETCASIVQAFVCRPLLPPLLLSRTNPSSVQASSSLSMVCTLRLLSKL